MVLAGISTSARPQSVRVETRAFPYRTTIEARAAAEQFEAITVPVDWQPVIWLAPDGQYVKEGDIVSLFSIEGLVRDLANLELERAYLEAEQKAELTALRNEDLELEDELGRQQDELAYLEAKQGRLRAMPLEDEITIEEGRLRVARLNHDAATKDLDKARERLAHNLITEAELQKFEKEAAEKKALLDHARALLQFRSLPASRNALRKVALEIENASMEIAYLRHKLAQNEQIAGIKRQGLEARTELIDQRIRVKSEEIHNATVTAPIEGHINISHEYKRFIQMQGGKVWKNFTFMKMPDLDTLVFKGALLESERPFFAEGDPVQVRVSAGGERLLPGVIDSFSQLSRDYLEKPEGVSGWGLGGEQPESGVKVFDMTIRIDEKPDWLRPGMRARCELVSGRTFEGPAVPLSHVKERDGEFHVALNGVYQPVQGRIIGGYLLLESAALAGKAVDLFGVFPEEQHAEVRQERFQDRFRATGELLPVETTDVFVQDVYQWPKVTWLAPEDSTVSEGEPLVTLDRKELNDFIQRLDSELKGHLSARDTLQEERDLKLRESNFTLAKERNLLEIAELDMHLVNEGLDSEALINAELAAEQARIRLDDVHRRLARARDKQEALTPLELARLEREKRRQELRSEQAQINLRQLEAGAKPLERSEARLKVLEQRSKVETLEKKTETENYEAEKQLAIAALRVSNHNKFMERVSYMVRDSTITSPAAGLVRYTKIWNSGSISKVNVGSEVGTGFKLMEIADISRMYVRVPVPERHFARIREGLAVKVDVPSLSAEPFEGEVSEVEYLFENRRREDTAKGLYSSQEPLGETIFTVRVNVHGREGVELKPGAVASIIFPFDQS